MKERAKLLLKTLWHSLICLLLAALCASAALAQQTSGDAEGGSAQGASSPGSPYLLTRGTNEYGVWGGGAFSATTAFGGLREVEAQDRGFVIAAFRYGRTLAANRSVALQYTLDVIPLSVATGNITSGVRAADDTFIATRRESTYGGGLTPLGLQLDFANGSRVKPFVNVGAGGLLFSKPVPLPDGSRFVFTLEGGGGVRVFTSERRALNLGVRLHHISNGDRSGSNRGLNQFIFYAGFSVFK